jgi:hypothetical protein
VFVRVAVPIGKHGVVGAACLLMATPWTDDTGSNVSSAGTRKHVTRRRSIVGKTTRKCSHEGDIFMSLAVADSDLSSHIAVR